MYVFRYIFSQTSICIPICLERTLCTWESVQSVPTSYSLHDKLKLRALCMLLILLQSCNFFFLMQFRWTYADPSWARIAALVPIVVSCAEAGDEVANRILCDSVQELASSVKAVVQRLGLCGQGACSA